MRQAQADHPLHTGARWLGIAIAGLPALDIADRSGLLTGITAPQTLDATMLVVPLLQIGLFVGLGVAATALARRLRSRDRWIFVLACGGLLLAYIVHGGLRLAAVIGIVALAFSLVQLRLSDALER